MAEYINLTQDNYEAEHLCCAIADKKHQAGVAAKRAWLSARMGEGHVFRKLDEKGKVFIEYAPLEYAWVPIEGENYLYIHCLWVSGKFKGHGHAKALLKYCIEDAKRRGKSGVCVLSAGKKKPFLSDKKFMQHFGFAVADTAGEYELLALSFDGTFSHFTEAAKQQAIAESDLTIYYSPQCPYSLNCIEQVTAYCNANHIPLQVIPVNTLEQAKALPCAFNNWAVFRNGKLQTLHLLNEGQLKKLLG